jgi:DNA-binding MarR family transcriptional regulator
LTSGDHATIFHRVNDFNHELASRLNSVAMHLARALRDRSADALPPEHLSALSAAVFGGQMPMGRLAHHEGVTAPAMTKAVGVLEQRGLARRVRDRQDRRVVQVVASLAGKRVVLRGRDRRVARIATALRSLEPADQQRLVDGVAALERLVATIEGHATPKSG